MIQGKMNRAPDSLGDLETRSGLARLCALPAIILLTVLSLALSVICLSVGYSIVFQNVFYLPILIACYCYQKKGLFYTASVATAYFLLTVFITGDDSLIVPALVRVAFFMIVGVSVVILTAKKNDAERQLERQKEEISAIIAERTKVLSEQLRMYIERDAAHCRTIGFTDSAINAISAPIVVWGTSGRVIKTNPKFLELAGKTMSEARSMNISETGLFDPIPDEPCDAPIVLEHGSPDNPVRVAWFFTEIRTPEGKHGSMVAAGMILPGGKGE